MPSSSVAGLPSMRATGRSWMWWLRNQALPSTQAFLALVILWSSTVSSMSSHTQPQKVQVALLTTLSSLMAMILWMTGIRVGDEFEVAGALLGCAQFRKDIPIVCGVGHAEEASHL